MQQTQRAQTGLFHFQQVLVGAQIGREKAIGQQMAFVVVELCGRLFIYVLFIGRQLGRKRRGRGTSGRTRCGRIGNVLIER